MLRMQAYMAVIAMAGALTASALAQNDPPCRLGSYPFVYAGSWTFDAKAGAPFSATVIWSYDFKLADGNSIHAVQRTVQARDAAGRTRTETCRDSQH